MCRNHLPLAGRSKCRAALAARHFGWGACCRSVPPSRNCSRYTLAISASPQGGGDWCSGVTMARRRKGSPVHGWVVLDKPQGVTSTQAGHARAPAVRCRQGRSRRHARSACDGGLGCRARRGHQNGALCDGRREALPLHRLLGGGADTDDSEGAVTATSAKRPSRAEILEQLPNFIGEILQVPPAYSAIKVDGERAYDLAREGETVRLEARPNPHPRGTLKRHSGPRPRHL
jgi:hypothetical protein